MTSTEASPEDRFDWRAAGLSYFACGWFLRARFGGRVQRVSVDGGFGCPNVEGAAGAGGCVFCDNRSFSPSRRLERSGVRNQIEEGIRRLRRRYACRRFLAYFQPGTNTYAPVETLRRLYEEAISRPEIVGLVIGTRPDCVDDPVLDLLEELAERTYLTVEYGMQSMHDRSLDGLGRGHHHEATVDAVLRSRGRGLRIGAHVILGIPGESPADMAATAREAARLRLDAVKIHHLHAVRGTRLAEQVQRGEIRLLDRASYIRLLADFLELLPATTVIDRICGDAPPEFLVGPSWSRDKAAVRRALEEEFRRRGSWQGRRCET